MWVLSQRKNFKFRMEDFYDKKGDYIITIDFDI